jgi:hypothetical protein
MSEREKSVEIVEAIGWVVFIGYIILGVVYGG